MRAELKVNNFDVGAYVAEDGIKASKDVRNEKSVIAMDGTKWLASKDKLILDVTILDMSDTQYLEMCRHLRPNPVLTNYTDLEKGYKMTNVEFYVTDLNYTNKKTIGNMVYVSGISFKLTQK